LECSHLGRNPSYWDMNQRKEQERIANLFYISQHDDQYCSHYQSFISLGSAKKVALHWRSNHSNIGIPAFITGLLLNSDARRQYWRTGGYSELFELRVEGRNILIGWLLWLLLSDACSIPGIRRWGELGRIPTTPWSTTWMGSSGITRK